MTPAADSYRPRVPSLAPSKPDSTTHASRDGRDERSGRSGHQRDDPPIDDADHRWSELRWALAGGIFAMAGVVAVVALVGQVSAFEASRLVEGIKPTATFAASTYIGAGATVLALMATMISFSLTHESEFRRSHYRRLRIIAGSTTALIVVALALLTLLVVPIVGADAPDNGYLILYWAIVGLGAVGAGLMVAIVLMLNYAVRGLVDLGVEGRSFLVVDD